MGPAHRIEAGMSDPVPASWRAALDPVLASGEARRLGGWLSAEEAAGKPIYPPRGTRLRALELTPLEVRPLPRSLGNIYKELESDLGIAPPSHGDLTRWAERGVLLLNTSLTVEAGRAGSHAGKGWEAITDACVRAVAARAEPSVFILWGAHAQTKRKTIPEIAAPRHLVIASPHPSPLSARRGFFGSHPFSRANAFLEEKGRGAVDWRV